MKEENNLLEVYFQCQKDKEYLEQELITTKKYKEKLINYQEKKENQFNNIKKDIISQIVSKETYNIKLYIIQETLSFIQEEIYITNKYLTYVNSRIKQANTHLSSINKKVRILLDNQNEKIK